jgi:hypothetical protein
MLIRRCNVCAMRMPTSSTLEMRVTVCHADQQLKFLFKALPTISMSNSGKVRRRVPC